MPAPVLLPWLSSKTDLVLHKTFAIKILWRISASFILFILKVAYDIIRDSLRKMLDTSCSNDVEQQMHDFISAQDGVQQVDLLQTRLFGNKVYVDVEISVNRDSSLLEAHATAERVHAAVELQFPNVKHVMIHVNPGAEVSV